MIIPLTLALSHGGEREGKMTFSTAC